MTRSSVCAMALAAQLVTVASQNVQIIPLNNETDPVQVGRTQYDASDPAAPVVMLTIVNRTQTVLSTGEIWFVSARFFTREEMRQNGDRIAWGCYSHGLAAVRDRSRDIQPGTEAAVAVPIPQPCRLDHAHEHFFVYVERITTGGRFDNVIWKRELGDALRVLLATPHRLVMADPTCPKCHARMEQGLLVDHNYAAIAEPEWADGEAQSSFCRSATR